MSKIVDSIFYLASAFRSNLKTQSLEIFPNQACKIVFQTMYMHIKTIKMIYSSAHT